ncbi:homocysteine biosynthesis protein [Lyngbya confervoides]|uniref:Homocysteine biosynthesis protein n=1 Tax=Lyngbya confervoides BDU141951 TaxID=1574623 RepID=A0ABD4T1A2_9CYAN|nr:homocysteine biosynthesis protein [Lyngbya confervoides]MCM1982268.1 homocysteine biosynthesis protein [Lyngbya confervoides BDU141951]
MRTWDEINDKIAHQQATIWTLEELKAKVADLGIRDCAKQVDVLVAGTFEPMESSGAILNLGQTDPPIKIRQCWIDNVAAYAGFGPVDLYLGAAHPTDSPNGLDPLETEEHRERGGGHVIEDLIAGKTLPLKALGQVTDCYPRPKLETTISKDTINQFYLFNPRNLYQNFIVGVNGGDRPLATHLGPLLPQLGNAVYSNLGALSPLLNDPHLRLIGIGSRIFLGGAAGYVTWEGTQHFPLQKRLANQTPIGPAATLALIGDAKHMSTHWVRGCFFPQYGPSLMLGIGIPFPVLDEAVIEACAVSDQDLVAPVIDFSIPRRIRPSFGLVTYEQLKQGHIILENRRVRTAPLASLYLARQVAETFKQQIQRGDFLLSPPVAPLPADRAFISQDSWRSQSEA